jgi:hypothetical protein
MKKKFISFGNTNSERFYKNITRIIKEANDFKYFDEIIGFTEKDLINDEDFWKNNENFIITNPRGFGYWIWKPHIINKELEKMKEGDILIYADSGCEINKNGKKRFLEYIDILNNDPNQYGIISFQLTYKEYEYTKKIIFDYFEENFKNNNIEISKDTMKNSIQCLATLQIIKKTKHSSKIIKLWSDITKNHFLINDMITNEEIPEFIENRHDQSIYSILVNIFGSIKLKDEVDFDNWTDGNEYPFLAKRL